MKQKKSSQILQWILIGLMIVIALLPLYLVVINAFKSHGDIVRNPLAFPVELYWQNFLKAWKTGNFGRGFLNSLRLVTADTVSSSSRSSDSQSAAASVDAAQQVASGKADAAFYTGTGDVGSLSQTQYAATTWVLAYNCSVPGLSNTAVRAGAAPSFSAAA